MIPKTRITKISRKSNFEGKNRTKIQRRDNHVQMPPYKIKTVEPIFFTTKEDRKSFIKEAHYNMFNLKSTQVMIDLLTDSGTGAMSAEQTSKLITGDESYAGATSYDRFYKSVNEITGFPYILPCHQGRAAERILFSYFGGEGKIVANNSHFDTTRANIESTGAIGLDMPVDEALNSSLPFPFKGNMNIQSLNELFEKQKKEEKKVSLVMMTITNNTLGGQPASLENIELVSRICKQNDCKLFFDGARFAENAYFIQQREEKYKNTPIREIVKRMFSFADGMTMSAKKDAIVHIGGWIALRDENIYNQLLPQLILTEGFKTYGGLAGRDLDAIALGIYESTDPLYLAHRIKTTESLG